MYKIYDGVELGGGSEIGEYAVIGKPSSDKNTQTLIGVNAHIRSHTVIYSGNRIGAKLQTGHGVLIRENNQIGNNVSVGSHGVIEHSVKIADGVRIHSNCFIPEFTEIGEEAWIGPCVTITNAKFPASSQAKQNLEGVIIGSKAKIGANCTLLPGIKIGEQALIGAGSVVTKDVEPFTVVAGNPAKAVGHIKDLRYSSENNALPYDVDDESTF